MHKTRKSTSVLSLLHTNTPTLRLGYAMQCVAVLHLCLDLGMPVNYKPHNMTLTLLGRSVRCKTTQCLELLIKYHADVDGDGFPIRIATHENRLDMVKLLIKAGVNVNPRGVYMSPIRAALVHASHHVVSHLWLAGAVLPEDALHLANNTQIDSPMKIQLLSNVPKQSLNVRRGEWHPDLHALFYHNKHII